MSYDVHLEADLGNGMVAVAGLDVNYTYNVAPMFREAVGSTPSDWNGRSASEVATLCVRVINQLECNIPKYDAMNPANGWGDRKGAVEFIREILSACRAAPQETLRVS